MGGPRPIVCGERVVWINRALVEQQVPLTPLTPLTPPRSPE
jgi:hypothetical protein